MNYSNHACRQKPGWYSRAVYAAIDQAADQLRARDLQDARDAEAAQQRGICAPVSEEPQPERGQR